MEVAKYVVPIDEIRQMAEKYSEVNSTEDFNALVAIEKEILSKLDYETLLDMAACMSVVANAVMLSKPSRERIFAQGFNTAKSYHARNASKKSHEETEKIKAEIIADYKANNTNQTKDAAASGYRKIYPLKFSTIRKYLKNI